MILFASVLAVTVIYNITSINIFERTREYATLMVLGYFKKEVFRLMFVENMILTTLGCLAGLPLGITLYRYLTDVISRSNLALPNEISALVIILSTAVTFVVSIVTNMIIQPKIKKIVIAEALKSVE
jgi:putative ABC transport system permease protein